MWNNHLYFISLVNKIAMKMPDITFARCMELTTGTQTNYYFMNKICKIFTRQNSDSIEP